MPNKILVVDDEPDLEALIRQKFRAAIRNGELIFDFAQNGAIALQKLQDDPEFDLVFTDINMPVMDGLTLLSRIKELKLIPKAVVISAYGDLKNIRTAMNRGAFDFITKPIDFADLETTLAKTINEMGIFRKGLEARTHLEKALIEKAEAQQQALINLQEKEKLILEQNEILEQQVTERTAEVRKQKELIEVKNKETLDSIHYAKRLQEAILPPAKVIKAGFEKSFILYLPKDIVAGDFYWIETVGDVVIMVIADCTGHGVSGALMSMMGVSLLNQIVNEKGIIQPSLILDQLHLSVISALKQTENNSNDGMDIAICSFNFKKMEMQFAGANRPLWIIKNGEMDMMQPDKIPVGGLQLIHANAFTNHSLALSGSQTLYLFTDGYADQFGGEKGKKLMKGNFRELLLSIQDKTMEDQEVFLKNYFDSWKGNNEQVDDVLVMGIRL